MVKLASSYPRLAGSIIVGIATGVSVLLMDPVRTFSVDETISRRVRVHALRMVSHLPFVSTAAVPCTPGEARRARSGHDDRCGIANTSDVSSVVSSFIAPLNDARDVLADWWRAGKASSHHSTAPSEVWLGRWIDARELLHDAASTDVLCLIGPQLARNVRPLITSLVDTEAPAATRNDQDSVKNPAQGARWMASSRVGSGSYIDHDDARGKVVVYVDLQDFVSEELCQTDLVSNVASLVGYWPLLRGGEWLKAALTLLPGQTAAALPSPATTASAVAEVLGTLTAALARIKKRSADRTCGLSIPAALVWGVPLGASPTVCVCAYAACSQSRSLLLCTTLCRHWRSCQGGKAKQRPHQGPRPVTTVTNSCRSSHGGATQPPPEALLVLCSCWTRPTQRLVGLCCVVESVSMSVSVPVPVPVSAATRMHPCARTDDEASGRTDRTRRCWGRCMCVSCSRRHQLSPRSSSHRWCGHGGDKWTTWRQSRPRSSSWGRDRPI